MSRNADDLIANLNRSSKMVGRHLARLLDKDSAWAEEWSDRQWQSLIAAIEESEMQAVDPGAYSMQYTSGFISSLVAMEHCTWEEAQSALAEALSECRAEKEQKQ